MEELQHIELDVELKGVTRHCLLKERDYGDYIVYDVSINGKYVCTLSKQGDVLFNEAELSNPREPIDPLLLNELVSQFRERIGSIQ